MDNCVCLLHGNPDQIEHRKVVASLVYANGSISPVRLQSRNHRNCCVDRHIKGVERYLSGKVSS